jgi:hypothetical protein
MRLEMYRGLSLVAFLLIAGGLCPSALCGR